ncbi:hypothetical protein [Massilia antarctica]|uniref:hypothetical protein n=1 Tax=Massilia antarctica TaxID=2765360 RepID=UPI0006BB78B4|nr:hypothetical protein [Massilia sp. H27-R4]MCY0912610.1 hypothetical protein [Massilia sp. H27-R4]
MINDQQTDNVGDGKMTPLEPQAGALLHGVEQARQMHGEMMPRAEPVVFAVAQPWGPMLEQMRLGTADFADAVATVDPEPIK